MIFKRPWLVIVLLVCVAVFTAGMLLRAWSAVREWGFLARLPMTASPLYLALTGALWGLFGLRVMWWLWQGARRAPAAVGTLTVGYVLYYWADQLFVMASPLRQSRWPFSAAASAAAVAIVVLILMHPSVKNFYGGAYEQEDQP